MNWFKLSQLEDSKQASEGLEFDDYFIAAVDMGRLDYLKAIAAEHNIEPWTRELALTRAIVRVKEGGLQWKDVIEFVLELGVCKYRISSSIQDAASHCSADVIELLVRHGGNINYSGRGPQSSALYRACQWGNLDVVKYLLDNGANQTRGQVLAAAVEDHMDIVKALVEKDPSMPHNMNLIRDVKSRCSQKMYDYLASAAGIEKEAQALDFDPQDYWKKREQEQSISEHEHAQNPTKENYFVLCASQGKTEYVEALLDSGVDEYAHDHGILASMNNGHADTCLLIADKIGLSEKKFEDIFWHASQHTNAEFIQKLLDRGIGDKDTLWASIRDSARMGKIGILEKVIDAAEERLGDIGNWIERTFHNACAKGQYKAAVFLISRGAYNPKKNTDTLQIAAHNGFMQIVSLLIDELGFDVNANNGAALSSAISGDRVSVAKLLVDRYGAGIENSKKEAWDHLQWGQVSRDMEAYLKELYGMEKTKKQAQRKEPWQMSHAEFSAITTTRPNKRKSISFLDWIAQKGIQRTEVVDDGQMATYIGQTAFPQQMSGAAKGKYNGLKRKVEYTQGLQEEYKQEVPDVETQVELNPNNKADAAYVRAMHKRQIKRALIDGKTVPQEVLDEYPEVFK